MFNKEEMKKKRIGVLMGGMSPEREVSLMSGKAILQALLGKGYPAVAIEADETLPERLREGGSRWPSSGFMVRWGRTGRFKASWR
jgi:D-alanine-D-alanine ligase